MNKSALKNFATKARIELIEMVSTRVDYLLGLGSDLPIALKDEAKNIQAIRERCSKEREVDTQKREAFIEEIAYTWFNRMIALRFMDANGITEYRVVSPLEGQTLPEIFNEAKGGTIESSLPLDKNKFYNIIDGKIPSDNPDNEAYKMLFIAVCNDYSKLMPFMFEAISDHTELLMPDDILSSNSIRAKVVEAMSDEDCENIEIIGWLYQFYIAQKKDEVFAALKKNKKITPSNIPAATQLFTPDWIVKYMVENSLGKLWMLNHPDSKLHERMKYYIVNEEESTDFLKISTPEELTILDPCMGSGHILTYAFDLLTQIYEEEGYNKSDIPSLILENNIYGCDIDKRAATLAQFALMMKARMYYRRFFKKGVAPQVLELRTESLNDEQVEEYLNSIGTDLLTVDISTLVESFKDVKNIGSLVNPMGVDIDAVEARFNTLKPEQNLFYNDIYQTIKVLIPQAKILGSTYACVVTNPPYMGSKGMNKALSDFVKKQYPDSKSDLFAVFMERTLELTKSHGFMSMINQHSWMFLSSYEKLRVKIIKNNRIDTLVHLGPRAFEEIGGEVVQSVAFVLEKGE
jgi:hypothetical protein